MWLVPYPAPKNGLREECRKPNGGCSKFESPVKEEAIGNTRLLAGDPNLTGNLHCGHFGGQAFLNNYQMA